MGSKVIFNYALDYEDGTSDGVHEHGHGDEEQIVTLVTRRLGRGAVPWFEFEGDDGEDNTKHPVLIFGSEDEAADNKRPIGRISYRETASGRDV